MKWQTIILILITVFIISSEVIVTLEDMFTVNYYLGVYHTINIPGYRTIWEPTATHLLYIIAFMAVIAVTYIRFTILTVVFSAIIFEGAAFLVSIGVIR